MIGPGLALLLAAGQVAPPAPRLAIDSFAQLPQPLPPPHRQAGNARAEIAAASARARRTGKRLLIELGADWCLYCRLFAATTALPELRDFLDRHFERVTIDVGRFDRNMAIPRRYGISETRGLLMLLVINPADDRLVSAGQPWARAETDLVRPQAIADWIAAAAVRR